MDKILTAYDLYSLLNCIVPYDRLKNIPVVINSGDGLNKPVNKFGISLKDNKLTLTVLNK